MTTTMIRERAPQPAQLRRGVARRSREAVVFSGAIAVALVHALDDAFLHRQPGVGLGQHALAAALALVLGLAAVHAFPSARPALRSALALFFGALATVNGTLHVKHIADQGAAASDLTGALAAAAGVALVGLAIAIPWIEGAQNSYGWGWPKDVAGALAFLKARDEVDPARIGALGLSTGADVLVQVAAESADLKAVVADGTFAGSFEDQHRILGTGAITPFAAVEFATVRVTSGAKPGPALADAIKRITSPLLLVSAGKPEKPAGDLYDRAAGDRPVEHWHLPEVGHTAAIREAAPEYERRVTAFFDGAL
jgi:hypothetical protein